MADINELDEIAHRLKVSWRKANNYFASFATILFEAKKQIDTGIYGPEWAFDTWLYRKGGMFEPQVMQMLKMFRRIIAAEERQKVEEATIQIAAGKRKAAEAKRAAAAQQHRERAIIKAHQDREREKLRAEAETERQAKAEEAKKIRARETARKRHHANRPRRLEVMRQRKAVLKAKLLDHGPENPDLARLLAECAEIERPTRVELGRRYAMMKEIVDTQQAGKDWNSQHWTWVKWADCYIHRSRQDINRCIAEFGTSCSITQYDTVVKFPKITA